MPPDIFKLCQAGCNEGKTVIPTTKLMCPGCWNKVNPLTQNKVTLSYADWMSSFGSVKARNNWAEACIEAIEQVNPASPFLRSYRVIAKGAK